VYRCTVQNETNFTWHQYCNFSEAAHWKLPDDCLVKPKHVAAFIVHFNVNSNILKQICCALVGVIKDGISQLYFGKEVYMFRTDLLSLYAFFWVISRRLNFICRRFGTLCLFHLHRQIGIKDGWVWKCWSIYTGKRFGSKMA